MELNYIILVMIFNVKISEIETQSKSYENRVEKCSKLVSEKACEKYSKLGFKEYLA